MTSYDAGADTVRGSRNDTVTPDPPPPPPPPPHTLPLHWFRISDNNPVVIDATVIDSSTYAVLNQQLPAGSTWAANASRYVSDLLGAGDDTQNVMHGVAIRNMHYLGLTADDANTVRHGMSGLDTTAGTGDDYTIMLALVPDCADAVIEIQWADLGPPMGMGQVLGTCEAALEYIGPQPPPPAGRIHFAMEPLIALPRVTVQINSEVDWGIFYDGFETGDLSRWSSSQ